MAKNETLESIDGMVHRTVTAFVDCPSAQLQGNILAIEEKLQAPVISNVPDFLGVVDLIIEIDDEVVIVDWKSSRNRWIANIRL